MLKAINPKAKLMDYIRHRYKQPETFNPDKYPLLESKKDPLRPFGWLANKVLGVIVETYGEKLLEMQKYDKAFEEKLKELNDQYKAEKKKIDDQYGIESESPQINPNIKMYNTGNGKKD